MHFGFIKEVTSNAGKLVVGLDIGTTKVCVVVAEVTCGSQDKNTFFGNGCDMNILGIGVSPSAGIKKGVVTNIESTVESIRGAVLEAESSSGVEIRAVHAGITGSHVSSFSSTGIIAVKGREIGQAEIDSVIDAAKAVAIPFDREILHVIPVGYTVDGQSDITDPRGMGGVRLETDVQILTGMATSVKNLTRSCEKAGLEVIETVFQPLASAEAVLTQDEKNLGAAIIDIGGGTTDVALFHDGNICHSSVLALGGNNFTNDAAIGLRIPTSEAEAIKKRYGCSMISLIGDDDQIEIGSDHKTGRVIPRSYLVEILQPRAEELFVLIKDEIARSGYHKYLNSGVVLTGGASLMEGIDVMAEHMLELPVRVGYPTGPKGMSHTTCDPLYATGIGLVLFGARETITEHDIYESRMFSGVAARMKGLVGGLFK
jgi:cell division protein FtsA